MRKIIIFGCGSLGKRVYNTYKINNEIVAFCDNDPKKQGKSYEGISVKAPSEICNIKFDKIIVSSTYYQSIIEQLHKYNIPHKKIQKFNSAFVDLVDILQAPKFFIHYIIGVFNNPIAILVTLKNLLKLLKWLL